MALVKKFEKIEKQRNSIHKEVDCTYTVFNDSLGEKILQLDTYGSSDRKIKGKVSQSIQLDKESAEELVRIIKEEFLL